MTMPIFGLAMPYFRLCLPLKCVAARNTTKKPVSLLISSNELGQDSQSDVYSLTSGITGIHNFLLEAEGTITQAG